MRNKLAKPFPLFGAYVSFLHWLDKREMLGQITGYDPKDKVFWVLVQASRRSGSGHIGPSHQMISTLEITGIEE